MKISNNHFNDALLQPLPSIARTQSGMKFDPNNLVWAFRDGCNSICINFALMPKGCVSLIVGLKQTLMWYLENRTARTAATNYYEFLKFCRYLSRDENTQFKEITENDIINFKSSSNKNAYALATIRAFLIRWIQIDAPGLSKSTKNYLSFVKLKQRPVGVAVATLDVEKGPFTDNEFEAIQATLNSAYAIGSLSLEQLMLCYLFMALGARPVQLASLKCGDLLLPNSQSEDFFLRVPRAKQMGKLGRSEFKVRRIAAHIGRPLATYVASIEKEFYGQLLETSEAPLFPQRRVAVHTYSSGFEFHQTSQGLAAKVIDIFDSIKVSSERLDGRPLPVSPIRFRRTFATRAAEEGWPLIIIAELMDHSNTRNVEVYAGLTNRIRSIFSRKIAKEMAPLANAFAGKIIQGEDEATRPQSSSRIIDLRVDRLGSPMGSCGTHVQCGFARPVACYGGCHEFEPWLDGPHEEALQHMFDRRAKLAEDADSRLAAINDRAILGCAQVIARCAEIKAGKIND